MTLDGEPIRGGDGVKATVYFNPKSAEGLAAVGLVDENGEYTLTTGAQEGAVPGQYTVTVTATKLVRPKGETGTPVGKRISPSRYASPTTSGLQYTVEPGDNTIDLALQSGAT